MIKGLPRSRKAISPILATLLLIVIAVAAIVVTYAWIMTYMGGAIQQTGVILYKENVRFYGTTDAARNMTEITVGNSGTTNTQILRIYMGNETRDLIDLTSSSDIGTGVPIKGGGIATVKVTWPNALANNWEPGKGYYFKVVPAQGQYLETPEQAPT